MRDVHSRRSQKASMHKVIHDHHGQGICRRHLRECMFHLTRPGANQQYSEHCGSDWLQDSMVEEQCHHVRRARKKGQDWPDDFQHNVTTTIGQSVYSAFCRGETAVQTDANYISIKFIWEGGGPGRLPKNHGASPRLRMYLFDVSTGFEEMFVQIAI